MGDLAGAATNIRESLRMFQRAGDATGEAQCFAQLGLLANARGRPDEGLRLFAICVVLEDRGVVQAQR